MKTVRFLLALSMLVLSVNTSYGQANVLDPNDPDVIFTATNQPALPTFNRISKWGHTNRLSWNPFSYGYKSYYFKGMSFRLKFPKTYQHNVADGKVYPAILFLHGLGEPGNAWDNEYQLLHGGQTHAQKIDNGTFDGFMIYPQSQTGWLQNYFPAMRDLVDSMVKYVKLDIDRVHVGGLSSGGQATWDFPQQQQYAKIACAIEPISAAVYEDVAYFASHITIPVFIANGGVDVAPYASTVTDIINSYKGLGGNIIQSFFPTQGHGVWNSFWADPRYWPWINSHHKANPLIFFQHDKFCPTETVNAKLGLQAGFYAYEWQKDGVTISGQTGNELIVTSYGTYRGRFKRTATSAWSLWSPTPAVISENQGTVPPTIQLNGLRSNVLPAPDGSTTAPLFVPNSYTSYEWRRISDNALVSSVNTYNAPVGQYKVKVTEQFGCGSDFSLPYSVIPANGSNGPDAATSVSALAVSNSSVQLYWNDNPNPANNETGFEIYRSINSGSGYTLAGITGSDILSFLDQGLSANKKYYYIIRAINNNAASAVSTEVNATTLADIIPPTAPGNLVVTGTTRSSVSLSWQASTDDVGVAKYEIYVNGVRSYVTTNLFFTVNNLTALSTYSFFVKALDATGNTSPASNQLTASAGLNGLYYKYYTFVGTWNNLPDFTTLTPVATGIMPNVALTPRTQNDNFSFLWEGYINIPVSGTYFFRTNSDDGSRLWLGSLNGTASPYSFSGAPLVNNDGLHGTQNVTSSAITLTAGVYPIAMAFYEQGGGEAMTVSWRTPQTGTSYVTIPNSAFSDVVTIPSNLLPKKPADLNVVATAFNNLQINWTDSSDNETGFEVYRSTTQLGTYVIVGTAGPGTTSFIDSVGLSAETIYWYKVRSVNQYGQSQFISVLEGKWGLNNNYNDGSGNNRNLTGNASPVFSTDKKEGSHSISLNGSNQYLNVPFGSSGVFPTNTYTTRSIGIWIKPAATMLTASNKIIYDFGGSDNGLSLRFNSGSLQAGIANNNNRFTVVLNNFATNPNWVANGWNHVGVTYNVDRIQLFLNGVLVGTTNLTFTSVGNTSNASRIGATNGSNAFNSSTSSTNYSGLLDNIEIINEPLNATTFLALMRQSYTADTTLALPGIPAAPSNLVETTKTTTSISVEFNDNSTDETSFELYRSAVNLNGYRLLATIPGGSGSTKSYTDIDLFPNSDYYYKVRAKGIGGTSAFTPDLLIRTNNGIPVLAAVPDFTMRHDSQKTINLTATDPDGETLVFSFIDPLPAFAVFTNTGNGAASIQFSPLLADQGVYTISAVVADGNTGKDTATFIVTVNDNYTPVIAALNNVTTAEGGSANINLSATDQDGNSTLTWSIPSPLPFVNLTDNGNGAGLLTITPGYTHAGVYPVTVNVSDGAGGVESATFNLTVTNVEPPSEKWYISAKYTGPDAPAPWNNIATPNTNNLLNGNGVSTPVGIEFLNTPWNAGDAGAVTGNNSGVYPDAVIKDYFWFGVFGAPNTIDFNLKGLTPGALYNVTLFGSSSWTVLGNVGTTIYTINGIAKPLYVHYNQQNTVTFSAVSADPSGNITVTMSKGANTPYGVLNALVLEKPFDDGTAPALPTNLSAQALPDGTVQLNWNDVAYNESKYLVHRATALAGPYTLLNPAASNANTTTYNDNTVLSSTTYHYKIEAVNNVGSSGYSNTASATTSNKPPALSVLNDEYVKAGNTLSVSILPTDDAGDVLTTTVTGLPSFGIFQSTGNGTGNIVFTPSVDALGTYSGIVVKVADNYGDTVTRSFTLIVSDNTVRSFYLNFGPEGGTPQAAPWNNFMVYPFANNPYGGIKDDANVLTGITFRLLSQWGGGWSNGMRTGNDKGVFPDNVMRTGFFNSNSGNHVIQFDGLNPAKLYSIGFLTNNNTGGSLSVTFTSGAQSVVRDGRYNTTALANLNGLIPNASGTIQVTISKGSSTALLNLNGVVIREYDPADPVIRPADLFAETMIQTDRIKLTWSDRSSNETGFEVWSSTSANGTYSLVTTTAANVTTYTNTGLTPNTRYFYKVRAVNGAVTSNYTNTANAILASKIVLINQNVSAAQAGPAPWNNTSSPSTEGATFSNLINTESTNSGYEMVITKEFNGTGFAGVNANGVFPANVMVSNYWTDAGQTSQVKFQNLDISKKYRIGCFGSNATTDYTTANYSCNGKTVELNSYMNDFKVVFLDNLRPGDNGELILSISTATGSPYSFTGAYTIEFYDDASPDEPVINTIYADGPPEPLRMITTQLAPATHVLPAVTAVAAKPSVQITELNTQEIKVFPNPFTSTLQVQLQTDKAAKIAVILYDAAGRLMYKNDGFSAIKGGNLIKVDLTNGMPLRPGIYVLNVLIDGKVSKVVKLIKLN